MKGERIETIDQLVMAAFEKKAVVSHMGRMPAAFIANMQAIQVWRMIQRGMWLYEKEKKK